MKTLLILKRVKLQFTSNIDYLCNVFFGQTPPPALSIAHLNDVPNKITFRWLDVNQMLNNSILLAVPKHRRTIEKRLKRKFGCINDFYKMLLPRTDLLTCNHCGHTYQKRHLCPTCYNKVKLETSEMQEAIEKELGLEPIEQEVVVLYKGERAKQPEEFWQGKRIIELKREKPSWFSKNLLQRTTISNTDSKDVKPSELA
ncbi:39S ribosomal protein L32, mitochondrial [Daktulosphaira vitifoliae]|uniref:39S ribosomal protein L32, mitochondrial n=1 Tax=Daktulosphaira vitifoliae TaxID=58002 RepID=UPI0021AAA4C8|nr:39S ribosomal protein L32, mitochondrial [Daktulosphaira vitifoliae]